MSRQGEGRSSVANASGLLRLRGTAAKGFSAAGRRAPLASAIGTALASGALSIAGTALAQDGADEVFVTGTRIRQDVYTSSVPMDVVTSGMGAVRGIGDIGTLLQTTTVAAGSPQVTAATSSAFVENGGVGAQTLSLRGLGPNRTLVLLNGRRAGPAGVRGGVSSFDFNVLPLAAIDRVEILKDGASSIYGSDAVAGVVNVITRRDHGATVDAYAVQPDQAGGGERRMTFSWGGGNDRGSLRVTTDHYEQRELALGARDYFRCKERYIFDPDTGERRDPIDPRTGTYHCNDLPWGQVWIYDYQEDGNVPSGGKAQFDYDGDLGRYIPGFASDPRNPDYMVAPPGWFPVGYDRDSDAVANADHPFQDAKSLIPKIERSTIFAEGELALTDNVQGYAEVLLNRRRTTVNDYRQFWGDVYNADHVFDDDGNLLPGQGNPAAAGWTGAQWLSPTAITDHADDRIEVDYRRVVVGAGGDLSPRWSWDVALQYSDSDGDYTNDQIFRDAIADQNLALESCAGTSSSVRGADCVDIPWLDPDFLRGNVSPELRQYLFGRETGNTRYTQRSIEGYVTGTLGTLPAGKVGAAFGMQRTEDEIRDVPGEITLADNAWNVTSAGITRGSDATNAVFAEFQVPLVAERPMIERLSLNVSARYTDVDSYGSDTTHKLGLDWQVTPGVRVRAHRGTSFRAPALFELYLADQTGYVDQRTIDPCIRWGEELAKGEISQRLADNCAADGIAAGFTGGESSATVITGGGIGRLQAETSESRTLGIVWQPRFADLSLSVDYFDIDVENEVDQLGADLIAFNCYDSEFFGNEPLCSLFERRRLDGGIDNVRDSYINIARQQNRGFDVSLLWRTERPWGTLTIETQHTRQNEDVRALFAETAEDLNGVVGDPRWVGRLNVTYDRGPWSYFWGANIVGNASNYAHYGGNTMTYRGETVRVVLDTDRVIYHALSASRTFKRDLLVRFGVANVLDEEPPQVTTLTREVETQGRSAFYSQYDWQGRRLFVNMTKSF